MIASGRQPTLLVVDDDAAIVRMLERFASQRGFHVIAKDGGQPALDYLRLGGADMALVDVRMPEVDGLQVLEAIRRAAPACRAVLMTGEPDSASAVRAVEMGAHDFLSKPLELGRIEQLMRDVEVDAERRRSLLEIEREVVDRITFEGMIGRGPSMESVFSLVRRLAPHARASLVSGEPGVGKDLVARALHALGPRHRSDIVIVNCSAPVPAPLDRELFGHTGAAGAGGQSLTAGLFGAAHGGTIVLDEVGDLPLDAQSRVLRVIASGRVQPVGAVESLGVDVHVIAATSRDLADDVETGRFRKDLYCRLRLAEIAVSPLRERREDIPYLLAAFVREFSQAFAKPLIGVTSEAERRLMQAPWPGNVRQLRGVIERACLLADSEWITERDLAIPEPPPRLNRFEAEDKRIIDRDQVRQALENANGNKKLAASRLRVSRRSFYRLLESRGLGEKVARRPR